MFRIGEFSHVARVSCRLLRYYDEIGLLVPAHVDAESGYRWYSASQLTRLNRILVLKDLGLSLEQIQKVIEADLGASELRGMLTMRRAELEQALVEQSERLRRIEARIEELDVDGRLEEDDVIVRSEPAARVLTLRRRLPSFTEAKGLVMRLLETTPRRLRSALGRIVVIAHSPAFEPDDLDLELGFFVENLSAVADRVSVGELELTTRELEGVPKLAVCVRVGPPEEAHATTARIGRFVEKSGLRLSGAIREVLLQTPTPEDPRRAVVEMQFPVVAREEG